jgi:hypothetical protein
MHAPEPLAEVDVWDIFAQFVMMVNVLDRGDEDVRVPRWDRGEIWHGDINLENGEFSSVMGCVRGGGEREVTNVVGV